MAHEIIWLKQSGYYGIVSNKEGRELSERGQEKDEKDGYRNTVDVFWKLYMRGLIYCR